LKIRQVIARVSSCRPRLAVEMYCGPDEKTPLLAGDVFEPASDLKRVRVLISPRTICLSVGPDETPQVWR